MEAGTPDRNTMANKTKETSTSAFWEKETKLLFCDFCLKEIELGNRFSTYFNEEGWQHIVANFNESTGRVYDGIQIKNKWDQLKKDWKNWKELKRGSTGLSWDPLKRTFDASEEWWTGRLAVVPAATKFKLCGLEPELEDKLDRMFGGVVATGKYACSPSETGFSAAPENVDVNLSCDSADLQSSELFEIQSISRFKRPRVKSGNNGGAAFLRNQISHLVETSNDAPHIVQANSIEQVVKIMDEDNEISEDFELYFFAVELLQDSVQRDFFTAIPKEKRVAYLRHFYARRHT